MIKYKNKEFNSYIALEDFMIRVEESVNEKMFQHSSFMYIKFSLEEKFKREFSIKEVKAILTEELNKNNIVYFERDVKTKVKTNVRRDALKEIIKGY